MFSSLLFLARHGRALTGESPECTLINPWADEQESHMRLGNSDKSAQRNEVQKLLEVPVDVADR